MRQIWDVLGPVTETCLSDHNSRPEHTGLRFSPITRVDTPIPIIAVRASITISAEGPKTSQKEK